MMHATEVEKARGIIEGIEVAQELLRSAAADIRLRCHYEPGSEDYEILTEVLNKRLALAKAAVTQAQSAESETAEGIDFSALGGDAPESEHAGDAPERGHKAQGSDGHAV